MLGALSVLTVAGWNALNATGASRRWREVAFDFAACYASSLFPEKQERRKAQDVLDIPYPESDTSIPSSPLSDTSSESSCGITATSFHQPQASPAASTPPVRRQTARPYLPPLTVQPHLPMPGVLAENGIESPNSPLNEPPILPSSRRTFKPRRKPAPAPIQTTRVDYDILEDDDEPIVDLGLYTPPTHSASSAPHISPLALKLTFKPSPYPSAMQRRFRNLSAVLTDDNMQSLAPSIYSISITIPTLSNGDVWVPQGLPNPFDGRTTSADVRVDHPSVLDGCSPLRYRNLFSNLREFKWSGALGKSPVLRPYEPPFPPTANIRIAQMRSDAFRLPTHPAELLPAEVAHTSTLSIFAAPSTSATSSPRSAHRLFGMLEKSGSANAANTTAEGLPELGYGIVTVENFPWNIGWENIEKFELVVSEDMVVQEGVEDLLNEIADEEDVIVVIIAEEVEVR
ncbi:hypothetical protein H1R20_g8924, partial [Candolleomyces eurysporus]